MSVLGLDSGYTAKYDLSPRTLAQRIFAKQVGLLPLETFFKKS